MTAAMTRQAPWRGIIAHYGASLPVPAGVPVITLGEGGTPLLPAPVLSELTGCAVYLKIEGVNPTGSFKDRGMTVAVTLAAIADLARPFEGAVSVTPVAFERALTMMR